MWISYIRKMRLLTHNMMTSHVKGVTNGYPFLIEASEIKENTVDFNPEFIARMIPRLEWSALVKALEMIGKADHFPKTVAEDYENNKKFLQETHHALMEIEIITGNLKCPESSRSFPITNGIPNMLLNEDEV